MLFKALLEMCEKRSKGHDKQTSTANTAHLHGHLKAMESTDENVDHGVELLGVWRMEGGRNFPLFEL